MKSQQELNEKMKEFDEHENRANFYPMFMNLMNNGFIMEAYLMILSTWNIAYFQKTINKFDLNNFKNVVHGLSPYFEEVKTETIESIEFQKYERQIKHIYDKLSEIVGVKYTGASKIMHLTNPNLYVMWDKYIRDSNGYKCEKAEDYLSFLVEMQKEFGHLKGNKNKTLAKCIDEYNYVTITLPALELSREKQIKKNKN